MSEKISNHRKLIEISKYGLTHNIIYTFLFVFIAFGSFFVIKSPTYSKYYIEWIGPVTSVMTLVIATGLALVNYSREWEDSLHKTLTVHFIFKGNYVFSCYYADLVSEGDIRNWAQQLGRQMTNGTLSFEPFFDLNKPKVIKLDSNKKFVKHYSIRVFLKADIDLHKGVPLIGEFYKRWYICHSENHKQDVKVELDKIGFSHEETMIDYEKDVFPKRKAAITNPAEIYLPEGEGIEVVDTIQEEEKKL